MKWIKAIICFLPLTIPMWLEAPTGLGIVGYWYALIFFTVLLGQILRPIPGVFIAILGLLAVAILGIILPEAKDTADKVLLGGSVFGMNNEAAGTFWILAAIFILSLGIVKTGLAKHLGYYLVSILGKSPLGLGYALAFLEAGLAWFIPSATVRSGGVVYPLVMGINQLFGTSPNSQPRKLGAYLVWVSFASSCVSSMLFLGACTINIMSLHLVDNMSLPILTWQTWLSTSLPAGVTLLLLTPLLAHWFYPPTIKDLTGVLLNSEGAFKTGFWNLQQGLTLGILGIAIILWGVGDKFGISLPLACLGVTSLLFLTRVLDWNDLFGCKQLWSSLIWFLSMYTLSYGLVSLGFFSWVLSSLVEVFQVLTPRILILFLVILFFLSHYIFAGLVVQATVILPMFLTTAMSLDNMTPEFLSQLVTLLIFSLGLMQVLTPYASGQGLIWYSSGYIQRGQFWFLGMVFGLLYLTVLLLFTIPWFSLQGFFM